MTADTLYSVEILVGVHKVNAKMTRDDIETFCVAFYSKYSGLYVYYKRKQVAYSNTSSNQELIWKD